MPIPLGILAVAGAGAGAAGSFDLLETTLISTNTASVTFSSLGSYSDYKHFQIRGTARSDDGNTLRMRINGDTTSSYARHQLQGNGTSLSSSASAPTTSMNVCFTLANTGNTADIFSGFVIDILDFASTNKNTTVRALGGNSQALNFNTALSLLSGVWLNTSAVTSLTILPSAGNLVSGSRLSLYGVK